MPTLFRIFGNLLTAMHHITNIRHFLLPCIGQIRTKSVIFGQGHLIALFASCGLLFAATIADKEDFQ